VRAGLLFTPMRAHAPAAPRRAVGPSVGRYSCHSSSQVARGSLTPGSHRSQLDISRHRALLISTDTSGPGASGRTGRAVLPPARSTRRYRLPRKAAPSARVADSANRMGRQASWVTWSGRLGNSSAAPMSSLRATTLPSVSPQRLTLPNLGGARGIQAGGTQRFLPRHELAHAHRDPVAQLPDLRQVGPDHGTAGTAGSPPA
jgi:hypothetical protein